MTWLGLILFALGAVAVLYGLALLSTGEEFMAEERFDARLIALVSLKDYGINRGFNITDKMIEDIGKLEEAYLKNMSSEASWSKEDLTILDQLTRSITEVTYPVTTENIGNITNETSYRWAQNFLWSGIAAALLSGFMMTLIKSSEWDLWKVIASILLGIVGAVVYVMLPNGKINLVAGLDQETKMTNISRIIIGGILGYVIYLIVPDIFSILDKPRDPSTNKFGLLYPLVGGYSISLVVGLLSKAVTAVELTLGLDEKKNVGSLRK